MIISMNEDIAHTRHLSPRYIWMSVPKLVGQAFGRLAHNLNLADHGGLAHHVLVKSFLIYTLNEACH